MTPWVAGEPVDLVELPASWYLDDAPPMMFVKTFPNSHGWVNPRDIEEMWRDQFDWVYRHYDYAIYNCVIHPRLLGQAAYPDDGGAAHRPHHVAFPACAW